MQPSPPPPTDLELIEKVKTSQDDYSMTELCKRHSGIVMDIAKRYSQIVCSGNHFSDLQDDIPYLIFKAAMEYNPDKGTKFVTWVGNKSRYYCLNKIKEDSRYPHPSQEENEEFLENYTTEEEIESAKVQEAALYVKDILNQLQDTRVKHIFEARYFGEEKNTPFSQIGKELGLSPQGVINIHNQGIQIIKNKLCAAESLDFV